MEVYLAEHAMLVLLGPDELALALSPPSTLQVSYALKHKGIH